MVALKHGKVNDAASGCNYDDSQSVLWQRVGTYLVEEHRLHGSKVKASFLEHFKRLVCLSARQMRCSLRRRPQMH